MSSHEKFEDGTLILILASTRKTAFSFERGKSTLSHLEVLQCLAWSDWPHVLFSPREHPLTSFYFGMIRSHMFILAKTNIFTLFFRVGDDLQHFCLVTWWEKEITFVRCFQLMGLVVWVPFAHSNWLLPWLLCCFLVLYSTLNNR